MEVGGVPVVVEGEDPVLGVGAGREAPTSARRVFHKSLCSPAEKAVGRFFVVVAAPFNDLILLFLVFIYENS